MPSLLDKLQKEMKMAGISPRTYSARQWLGEKLKRLRIPSNRSNILTDAKRISAKAFIGRMYFFHYDAKYKDILPVWDKFPLVIPIETYSNGFLGLNFHFLDQYSRLILLDRLNDFATNDKYDDTTSFKLSYKLLSSSRRYSIIEQCTRKYLFSHIMSSMIYIEPESWETAIFLPVQKMVYNN